MLDPLCERARMLASLDLDGETGDLERRRLERHLEGCPVCASFVAGMRGAVAAVRATPAEQPSRPFSLPAARRRPLFVAARVSAVAAVLAVAAGLGVLGDSLGDGTAPAQSTDPQFAYLTPEDIQMKVRGLRLEREAPGSRPDQVVPGGLHGGVV